MAKKQFKLTEDLEGLIGDYSKYSNASEMVKIKPSTDDVDTRNNLFKLFGDARYLNMDPAPLIGDLDAAKSEKCRILDEQLSDDTYKEGMAFYRKELSPEITARMYARLISKEISMPENASDELKEVADRLNIADAIEKALVKGDMKKATALADRVISNGQKNRMMYNDIHGGAAYEKFKEHIVADVANAQRSQAYKTLAEGKLYAEIDGAIAGAEYGKAKSFMAAYGAYATQQEVNKQRAEAEAKKAQEEARRRAV